MIHEEIWRLLEADRPLTAAERAQLDAHLNDCADCTRYARTIDLLRREPLSAHRKRVLSAGERRDMTDKISQQVERRPRIVQTTAARLGTALAAVAIFLLAGAFIFTYMRPGSELSAVADETPAATDAATPQNMVATAEAAPSVNRYDGWELGAAFDLPPHWMEAGWDGPNSVRFGSGGDVQRNMAAGQSLLIVTARPYSDLNSFSLTRLTPADTALALLLAQPTVPPSREMMAALEMFEAGALSGAKTRYAAPQTDGETMIDHLILYLPDRFLEVVQLSHSADAARAAADLQTVLNSVRAIDYSDWQLATTEDGLQVAYPAGWYLHNNGGKSAEITPSAQPAWSSSGSAEQAVRFQLLHNLNRQLPATPLEAIAELAATFGESVTLTPLRTAATLPLRPDVALAVYDAGDGDVVLFGALLRPDDSGAQPVIIADAVVPLTELDVMQQRFERMLRSIRSRGAMALFDSTVLEPVMTAQRATAIALQFGQAAEHKPIGGGVIEPIETQAVQMTYADAINLLGRYAVAEYGGANWIGISPASPADAVWFVEVFGRWQEWESPTTLERTYVGVVAIDSGVIVAAGSSDARFLEGAAPPPDGLIYRIGDEVWRSRSGGAQQILNAPGGVVQPTGRLAAVYTHGEPPLLAIVDGSGTVSEQPLPLQSAQILGWLDEQLLLAIKRGAEDDCQCPGRPALFDWTTGELTLLSETAFVHTQLSIAADGSLAIVDGDDVLLWRDGVVTRLDGVGKNAADAALAPDGERLALVRFGDNQGHSAAYVLVDLRDNSEQVLLPFDAPATEGLLNYGMQWSADGERLALSPQRGVWLLQGEALTQLEGELSKPLWLDNFRLLLRRTERNGQQFELYDVRSGRAEPIALNSTAIPLALEQ